MRDIARTVVGNNDFIEVYLDVPLEICEKRDVKGLYKKARAGEIKNFTGITSPYEVPLKPDIIIKSFNNSLEDSTSELYKQIQSEISIEAIV